MPQRYFGAWGYPSANDACTISAISSGGLAQLVELLPRKQRVNGSIPLTSTIETTKKLRMQLLHFWALHFAQFCPPFRPLAARFLLPSFSPY